ncbi:glucosamine-6-phosphate deaminase [Winogradskyella sp. PC-19]|uniref:TonB-dependent receptor domain-containing protein n=1 Tax=unclassified Winogradskyella TaxID=2615021 RepID=UPI000B3BF464|nr:MULTISPECIES: outer membrane beta-barrel family protein [unclassified Winogradskyella]ARV09762.1 glucosamine-6-phosphate deaminase [Winogradskyella sp. PC-19]RZN82583.1 MAG: TonB-dependent receptor [Winogradskyella sp.]
MSIRLKPLISAVLFMFSIFAFSQELTLTGKVVDEQQKPISFANITLFSLDTEIFIKGTSSNDDGVFELTSLSDGTYTLKISFIGFKTIEKTVEIKGDVRLKNIVLVEDSETLEAVTVNAKRPTIIRKPDRLTFNIENTALTEGSTLQVLKSTPGIIVSEGSINIKSSPATVFINNRRVQLTSDELIQLLESAPANSVKSVDVITNPPASYDADSGSVINIIMSKNLVTGYRGSVATNYTQGAFPRYNAATSHYFKNDKINLNLNYSYTNQKINREEENGIDYFDSNGNINQIWNSDIDRNTKTETHNANINFDYYVSDKTTLSLTSTALFTPYFKYRILNLTDINDANSNFLENFTANNLSRDDKFNIGSDLNLSTEFDNGSRLSFNGHYTIYNYSRNQAVFQNNSNQPDSEFNTVANQNTDIYTAKIDYSLPINDSSSFETGLKFSNINTESDITRVDVINGSEVINTANSNIFNYDENVFAAYANYSKSWEKWDIVVGLRAEQTNVDGFSPTLNQTNTQDYFKWFPNASISHNFSDNFSLYGNYKRSITRPSYTSLNPFTFFINENTIVVGKPDLQPTFQDHFVVGSSFLEYFTVEAYYINYDGAINELPRQNNNTNILAYTPTNLDKTVDYGFDFSFYYPKNRWSIYFVTSFFNITEEANLSEGFTDLSQWSNYSILQNTLSLLEDNSLNLSLTLTWVGKNVQQLSTVEDRLFSEFSLTKSVLKNKGVISLSVEDIFNYQDAESSTNYFNQSNRQFVDIDNRFVKLGFRYKFGNTKLSTNERATDAEERDRIKDLQ